MLEVGVNLKLIPTAAVDYYGRTLAKPLPCKVVYINHKHRFYTVEFTFPDGGKYRESFKFGVE